MDDQHRSGTEHTEGFGLLLQRYRERAGLGCGELARAAKLHPSYLSRLERGERTPTQPVVESLIQALELDPLAADGLRVSVGYAPLLVAQLGTWPMALQTVAAVLVDEVLTEAARERFGAFVRHAVESWLRQEAASEAPPESAGQD
jgi:transcriptional regulator with XRE-family HTH domain